MTSWHERLQTALTTRNKSWAELVQATGLTEQSVYAWRPDASKRTVMMAADNAAHVCTFLMINPTWLFDGTGDSGLENGKKHEWLPFRATTSEIETLSNLRLLPESEARAITDIIQKLASLQRSC